MHYCLTTRLRESDATHCVSTSLLSFNAVAISMFVCVFSASFTCSLVKLFSCKRERKEKEHVNCLSSDISIQVDQRLRPKGLRLQEYKVVEIILVEVKTKMFGNLSFRYLLKRAFY